MPRSLSACVQEVCDTLVRIRNRQSGGTQLSAFGLLSELQDSTIEEILKKGLHLYLTEFLDRINRIGSGISGDFLMPLIPEASATQSQQSSSTV